MKKLKCIKLDYSGDKVIFDWDPKSKVSRKRAQKQLNDLKENGYTVFEYTLGSILSLFKKKITKTIDNVDNTAKSKLLALTEDEKMYRDYYCIKEDHHVSFKDSSSIEGLKDCADNRVAALKPFLQKRGFKFIKEFMIGYKYLAKGMKPPVCPDRGINKYKLNKSYFFDDLDTNIYHDCGGGFNVGNLKWVRDNKGSSDKLFRCFIPLDAFCIIPIDFPGKIRVNKVDKIVQY